MLKFWVNYPNVWRLCIIHTSSDKLSCQVLSLGNRHLSIDSDGTHSSQTVRVQNHLQGQMFYERRNVSVGKTCLAGKRVRPHGCRLGNHAPFWWSLNKVFLMRYYSKVLLLHDSVMIVCFMSKDCFSLILMRVCDEGKIWEPKQIFPKNKKKFFF